MNIAPTQPTKRTCSPAFTLIELMVVISIMALLGALIVGLAIRASEHKKITRVQAELSKWTTMIEAYHDKLGFYPPCNPTMTIQMWGQPIPIGLAVTPLFYELEGALFDGTTYTTLGKGVQITSSDFKSVFGLDGIANSATEKGESTCFDRSISFSDIITNTLNGTAVMCPRVPVEGPPPYGILNTWHYNSKTPTHNTNAYDIWAEIMVGGKTNIIGNWKR